MKINEVKLNELLNSTKIDLAKSGIKIKKANRGKFTEYCGGKVTAACIAKGKRSPNPVIRKRATFAQNARKWKHLDGGVIIGLTDYLKDIPKLKNGSKLVKEFQVIKTEIPESNILKNLQIDEEGWDTIYDNMKQSTTSKIEKQDDVVTNKDESKLKNLTINLKTKTMDNNDLKVEKDIYKTRFTKKDIPEFTKVMSQVYSDVLDEMGLPKDNLLNLVRQSALESDYGLDPRGNGFNLGGIKNFTGDLSRGTVYKGDNMNYLNFDNLKDYAKYKVNLLNSKYKAIDAPENEFVERLHGGNPEKRSYSANKIGYARNFAGMKSLDNAFKELFKQ